MQNTGHELSHSFSGMNLHNCKFLDLRPQDLSHEHNSVATIQFNSENSNLENKKNNPIAHKFFYRYSSLHDLPSLIHVEY